MTTMLAGSMMPLITIKRLIAIRCLGATLKFFSRKNSSLVCWIFPALFPINLLSLLPFNGAQPVGNKNLKSIQESSINTYFISFISFAALSSKLENRMNLKKIRMRWRSDALLSTQMHYYLLRCAKYSIFHALPSLVVAAYFAFCRCSK